VSKANILHNNKYTYTKTIYVRWGDKVIVTCPIHGDFKTIAGKHIATSHHPTGCPKCANKQQTTEDFINKSRRKHNDIYIYNNSVYINDTTKIRIDCKIHGPFWMLPSNHHSLGQGCSKCTSNHHVTTDSTIKKCIEAHGDKYDYSQVEYVNDRTPIKIICKKHGTFLQLPYVHWAQKAGCQQCARDKAKENIGYYNNQLFNSQPWIKEETTKVYIIKLTTNNEHFFKIGISNNPNKRCIPFKKYYSVELLTTIDTTLWIAWNFEQFILKNNQRHIPLQKFKGWTECITTEITNKEFQEFVQDFFIESVQ